MKRAAFLDRDGVINLDRAYVHRWEDFEFVPGAIQAMRLLKSAGYLLVVVTNQSGIARRKYSESQFHALTKQMRGALAAVGADVDAVYHCPHHPSGSDPEFNTDCDCRKPKPGMLLRAARDLGLSLPESILVGDKPSDIEAARAAGVGAAYLVMSDNEESRADAAIEADGRFADLAACVAALLGDGESTAQI